VSAADLRRPVSFVAEVTRIYDADQETLFDRLADASGWSGWMPASFRPVGGARGPLRVGDRRLVLLASGLPVAIVVTELDRPRALTWRGGVRGVLRAEHRFLFEPADDGRTQVRSVETWSGVLAAPLRRLVLPLAERIGRDQLAALDPAGP
jgi:hypothetical protein